MPATAFGPREEIGLAFARATMRVAQHPGPGVAEVGATVARNVLARTITPEHAANFTPSTVEIRRQVAVAEASHELAGVYGIPRNSLIRSVAFAFRGLVVGGLVQVGAEFRKGGDGSALTAIGVPTLEDRAAYEELLANRVDADKFGRALGLMTARFANPMDVTAQRAISGYHQNIVEVSARYADSPRDPGRMQELGEARQEFSEAVRTPLLDTLPIDVRTIRGEVLVDNVLRHTPTGPLVGVYFPALQA